MAKSPKVRIALVSLENAVASVRGRPPPTVDLDRARKLVGPDMRLWLKEGWGDDDILAALLEADEGFAERHDDAASGKKALLRLDRESLIALLTRLREKEAEARRKRERQSRERAEEKRARQDPQVSSAVNPSASPPLRLSNQAQTTAPSPKLLGPSSSKATPDRNPGID